MINQLAERIGVVALSIGPSHLMDRFLDWLEELRSAMALDEINSLAREEARTRVLID